MQNIFIAGHNGMVGSALVRKLNLNSNNNLICAKKSELNLLDQSEVLRFFKRNRVDQVYLAAAKVGGIHANNTYPAEFIYENLTIQNNVIHSSYLSGVKKLLFLGSSCIYPKFANQPISENELLSGRLERTNEPYAIAKIAGIKLCESYNRQYGTDYRSVMPTNLYGPNDNFHPKNSHVIPALIRRFHEAKENGDQSVTLWGSGSAYREFLHVDDMAAACIHVMQKKFDLNNLSHVNVGCGVDLSIKNLSEIISDVVGYKGSLKWDNTKPDGTPKKLLDCTSIFKSGWKPLINLQDGLSNTYSWYLNNLDIARV
ncbi:GDP-L-fucose synthase [Sessilibacter corallicola]|uniref:GDP-L-fucose synthase n=1 Tax=Sessilibacter corallicola TaxID=2904075 RepID=A0ABQ0A833_9GAMM